MRDRSSRRIVGALAAALCAAVLLAGAAHAQYQYRKHKNPRRRKPAAAAQAAQAAQGPARPAEPPPLIEAGRWDPAVRVRVSDFIRANGKESPSYDPNEPPAAVFSVNDVILDNDLGEALFQRMALRLEFKFDDAFWPIVPTAFGSQRLRADYEGLLSIPVSIWPSQPGYGRLRKGFVKAYRDFCERRGRKECRGWLARLFVGFSDDEAVTYCKTAIEEAIGQPTSEVELADGPTDRAPLMIREGLQPVPEMKDLLAALGRAGFDVYLVSDDAQFAVRQLGKQFGLQPERGIGIKVAYSTATAKLSDELEPPFPFRAGKVAAASAALGRPPVFAAATRAEDMELLSYGPGLRLLIDRGDETLRRIAVDRGWLVQPAFPASPAR